MSDQREEIDEAQLSFVGSTQTLIEPEVEWSTRHSGYALVEGNEPSTYGDERTEDRNAARDMKDTTTTSIHGQTTSRNVPRRMLTTMRWWWPELLASFFSIATLLSIIVVLQHYNSRTLSDLALPSGLTLNGLVAALSTLNRALLMAPVGSATMQELWLHYASESTKQRCRSQLRDLAIFDGASRGVWGSFVLLYYTPWRTRRLMAAAGAVITILSLAFGTFTQQLITYNELKPTEKLIGNVPRAEVWDAAIITGSESTGQWLPPREIVAALYNGILTTQTEPVAGFCPSGNCTWPLTPSVAVCGACQPTSYNKTCFDDNRFGPTFPFCNYTLESGATAMLFDFDTDPDYDQYDSFDAGYAFRAITATNGSADLVPGHIVRFDLVGAPVGTGDLHDFSSKLKAWNCSLDMCVNVYEAETVDSVHDLRIHSTSRGTAYVEAVDYNTVTLQSPESFANTKFNVSLHAYAGMTTYLERTLSGAVFLSNNGTQGFDNDLIYGIWNGTSDVDAWIERVRTSLTNVIRTLNSTTSPEYDGMSLELGVTIRWAWIALPVAMVALSIIMLVAVMVETAFSPVEAWKGSPLIFLLFGLDEDIRLAAKDHTQAYCGVDKAVGLRHTRLSWEIDNLWKFKSA